MRLFTRRKAGAFTRGRWVLMPSRISCGKRWGRMVGRLSTLARGSCVAPILIAGGCLFHPTLSSLGQAPRAQKVAVRSFGSYQAGLPVYAARNHPTVSYHIPGVL